jgi:UDP-glucose:(heptosyl)LPS alpha-1,3-glucosyltransferase
MRIAIISQSCDNETGIGRIVLSLGNQFDKLGNEVHVAAQRIEGIHPSVHKHPLPRFTNSNGFNKLLLRVAANDILRNGGFDVVHSFGVGRGATIVSAQSCHRAGMTLLQQPRRQRIWRRNLGGYDRISLSDERTLFCSPTTRKIIAVSQLVKEQIVSHYGVARDRIVTVPNGVDFDLLSSLKTRLKMAEVRRRLRLPIDSFVLLFVGNEFDRKGLQTVITSLPQAHEKGICLVVVGGDEPRPYQKLAAQLRVLDQIVFVGAMRGPEEFYGVADALVLPALYEPFGMVIVESMAACVPVITSRDCGAVEGMTDEQHGLFLNDPLDSEELANAINRLVDDRSLRENLQRSAQIEAKRFSWDLIAKQILAIYELSLLRRS